MTLNSNIIYENGWVKVRYRRVRNSDRILDAHTYGYEYWCFPVKKRKH